MQEQKQQARLAAIYARVSSERQRTQQTIASQVAALRELAGERGLAVVEEYLFCDEGVSGAVLARPALERLRDRAAEGAFDVLLCHSPDRLARRYAYQVLLLEELGRCGVEVCFAHEQERTGSPEQELLRQFQGMIAEYERAQIRERTRRGKLHRARSGSQAVMARAPYGYRYVRKSEYADAYFEVDEAEAAIVGEIFRGYTQDGHSTAELARRLTKRGVATRNGRARWSASTIWGMLRNPAYRGEAAFGKTKSSERYGKATRVTRARGGRHSTRPSRERQPAAEWALIPVPALVSDEQFALAQTRLKDNKRFARRNAKQPSLLKGILFCRECGYACHRTSSGKSGRRIAYYRCSGRDAHRRFGGPACESRSVRADELDELVWVEVRRLLCDPTLVRAEIDRRLEAVRAEQPAGRRREALEHQLARADAAAARLIEAYQEQLVSLDELRARMPALRKRQSALRAQHEAAQAELHDTETYVKLADTLEGFLARLDNGLDRLDVEQRQRVLRLVVREVLIGGDDDAVTIRHSIPIPSAGDSAGGLLHTGSLRAPSGCTRSTT